METAALGCGLKDIGDDFFHVKLGAGIAGFFGAGGTDFIGHEAIGGGVDGVQECVPEMVEAVGFEAAFKDGVLDAHAEILADPGNLGEAFVVGDVVGDKGEHLFFAAAVAADFAGSGEIGKGIFPPVVGDAGLGGMRCGRGWFGYGRAVLELETGVERVGGLGAGFGGKRGGAVPGAVVKVILRHGGVGLNS